MNNLDTWSIRQIKIETNNDRYTHTNSCISTQDNLESKISSTIQIEERIEPVHERKNNNEKLEIEPVHKKENSNEKIADLDDIPIPWKLNTIQNNKDMTLNEIILLKSHQLALIKVKKDLPKNFGIKIIDLMKAMYQKRNLNESIIEISNTFLYSNHWIAYKFNDLINTFNSREYLIEKWSDNNYKFIQKTQKQDYEIRDISGAARILYDILIPSSISVSIEYLCMLAVLMTQDGNKKFWSAELTLENDNQIDLLMEKGVIVFKNHKISDNMTKKMSTDTSSPLRIDSPSMKAQWKQKSNKSSKKLENPEQMKSTKSSCGKASDWDQKVGSYQKPTNLKEPHEPILANLMHKTQVLPLYKFGSKEGYHLYIKGLSRNSTNKDIRKLFSKLGSIKVSKTSETTATIKFKRKIKAIQAMTALNGTTIQDHTISISMTKEEIMGSTSNDDCTYPKRISVWHNVDIIPMIWNEPEKEKIDSKPVNTNDQVEQEIVHIYKDSQPPQQSSPPRLIIDDNVQSTIKPGTSYENELSSISRMYQGTYIHTTIKEKFKSFNQNAWEIISTENVNIDPYDQLNLLVKISYWNLTQTLEYTTHQTQFFITCGLCPDPQVVEGVYETKNTLVPIMVRNSSPIKLILKMGTPIKAVSAHTQEFVTKSLKQYSEEPECLGMDYKLTRWHGEAKVFKKLNACQMHFNSSNK